MRLRNACLGAASVFVLGVLGTATATASATFEPCGNIVGYEHVVALKVEVKGMSCKAASAGIKSSKTPAQLGYDCHVQVHAPLAYYTCDRRAGGTVKFRERVQQGKA